MRIQRRNSCMYTHIYSFDALMLSRQARLEEWCMFRSSEMDGLAPSIRTFHKNSMRALPALSHYKRWTLRRDVLDVTKRHSLIKNAFS